MNVDILIDGKLYGCDSQFIPFLYVVEAWNELNAPRHITGNPGIDYVNDKEGNDGILFPGERVAVKSGTQFRVTPYHNG